MRSGPDAIGVRSWTAGKANLTLKGWVLSLRGAGQGRDPVRQPLSDASGNILVFNGEVFGGIEVHI